MLGSNRNQEEWRFRGEAEVTRSARHPVRAWSLWPVVQSVLVPVFRLPWELNLLLSCFWLSALYSRIYCNGDPHAGLASLNHGTVRQLRVRFNLREEASAPSLYPSYCIIYAGTYLLSFKLSSLLWCMYVHCTLYIHTYIQYIHTYLHT